MIWPGKILRKFLLVLILPIILSCSGNPISSASARESGFLLKSNSRLSWGFDSNVHESVREDRRVSDSFIRAEAGLDLSRTNRKGSWPRFAFRLASDRYTETKTENRLVLFSRLSWRRGTRSKWLNMAFLNTRSRFPDNKERNISRNELTSSAALPLAPGMGLLLNARLYQTHSPRWNPGGRKGGTLGCDLIRTLNPRWRLALRLGGGITKFDYSAWDKPDEGTGISQCKDEKQLDDYLVIGTEISHTTKPLIRLYYGFKTIDSNNFGFSHFRHECLLTASYMLPWKTSLQLIGRMQKSTYAESGYLRFQPGEDAEDLDLGARSGITLQLRRPVSKRFTLEIQTSWQKNQVLVSGKSYEKTSVTAGFYYQIL